MKIDVLTLFPEMFLGIINESIMKRAIEKNLIDISIHNIRDFSKDSHKRVDDYSFGGGAGMVLMIQPIYDAIQHFKTKDSIVIMMTPQGSIYQQKTAYQLSKYKHIIILCGHYEGFDERICSLVDMEISIGDYILTGESFNNNLLDYPVYTKPVDFMGMKVPDVLLSGHHENIRKWRLEQQIKKTTSRRPDLLEKS